MKLVTETMQGDVVFVEPEKSLLDVIGLMRKHNQGAAIVQNSERVLGIFSEHDLLTKIDFKKISELRQLKVEDYMTTNFVFVEHDELCSKAYQLMYKEDMTHIPVCKDNKIIGIIHMRDVAVQYEELMRNLHNRNEELVASNNDLEMNEKALRALYKDLEKMQMRLRETQHQLIQSEKLRSMGLLAGGVAHEIRNPLQIIIQGVDFLIRKLENKSPDVDEVLQIIRNNIIRSDKIVSGLLEFSRKSQPMMKAEDINDVVQSSVNMVSHQQKKDDVKVIFELGKELPLVLGNRVNLEQVFVNILMNAFDAIQGSGTITIRTYDHKLEEVGRQVGRRVEDHFHLGERIVVVEVEDSGKGLTAEEAHRAFEPFFTTKDPGKGTGLGLSVTKNIIDMHMGFIDLKSEPGKGTKFTLGFKIGTLRH